MTLGQQIKLAREARGLEPKDLAELVGVSTTAVIWWEADKHAPRIGKLRQLEAVLETQFNYTGVEPAEGQSALPPGVSQQDVQLAIAISRLPAAQRLAIQTLVETSAPNVGLRGEAVKPFLETVEGETPPKTTQPRKGRSIQDATTTSGSNPKGRQQQQSGAARKKEAAHSSH